MIVQSNNIYNFITQEKPRPFTVTEGDTAGTVIVSPGKCFFYVWKIPIWSNLPDALGAFDTERVITGTQENPDILSLLIQFEDNGDDPAEVPSDPDEEVFSATDVFIGWYGREANDWPIDRVFLTQGGGPDGDPNAYELETQSFQGKGYIPLARAYVTQVGEGDEAEQEVIIEQLIDYNPILPMETRKYFFGTTDVTTTTATSPATFTTSISNQTYLNEFSDP